MSILYFVLYVLLLIADHFLFALCFLKTESDYFKTLFTMVVLFNGWLITECMILVFHLMKSIDIKDFLKISSDISFFISFIMMYNMYNLTFVGEEEIYLARRVIIYFYFACVVSFIKFLLRTH